MREVSCKFLIIIKITSIIKHQTSNNKLKTHFIIGSTGIGKTKLAIEVAKYFDTEIISCDSRQFFKEMKIGTAMPSKEELEARNIILLAIFRLQIIIQLGNTKKML
jgi:tRNA A37 N6-isopentenylltransferase MiaA